MLFSENDCNCLIYIRVGASVSVVLFGLQKSIFGCSGELITCVDSNTLSGDSARSDEDN